MQGLLGQLRRRATTILILRGILAIALGFFLVAAPALAGASLGTLIAVFIAFWLIWGCAPEGYPHRAQSQFFSFSSPVHWARDLAQLVQCLALRHHERLRAG